MRCQVGYCWRGQGEWWARGSLQHRHEAIERNYALPGGSIQMVEQGNGEETGLESQARCENISLMCARGPSDGRAACL